MNSVKCFFSCWWTCLCSLYKHTHVKQKKKKQHHRRRGSKGKVKSLEQMVEVHSLPAIYLSSSSCESNALLFFSQKFDLWQFFFFPLEWETFVTPCLPHPCSSLPCLPCQQPDPWDSVPSDTGDGVSVPLADQLSVKSGQVVSFTEDFQGWPRVLLEIRIPTLFWRNSSVYLPVSICLSCLSFAHLVCVAQVVVLFFEQRFLLYFAQLLVLCFSQLLSAWNKCSLFCTAVWVVLDAPPRPNRAKDWTQLVLYNFLQPFLLCFAQLFVLCFA